MAAADNTPNRVTDPMGRSARLATWRFGFDEHAFLAEYLRAFRLLRRGCRRSQSMRSWALEQRPSP